MNRRSVFYIVFSLITCAVIYGNYYSPYLICTESNSFSRGFKDAITGQALDTSFVADCFPESQGQVRVNYHDGYSKGRDSLRLKDKIFK